MLVCVAADENIAVELPLHGGERLHVAPRDDLVPVNHADLKVMDLDHLGLRQVGHFIAITTHDMRLTFCSGQVLEPLDCVT